jgi:hypothetical protein
VRGKSGGRRNKDRRRQEGEGENYGRMEVKVTIGKGRAVKGGVLVCHRRPSASVFAQYSIDAQYNTACRHSAVQRSVAQYRKIQYCRA